MSTDEKYSCTAEFGAELLMYIGVILTMISVFPQWLPHWFQPYASLLFSPAYFILVPIMSYLFSMEKHSNPEGRAQLILIWMVLVEINHTGYVPIKFWGGLEKLVEQLVRLIWVGYLIYTYTPIQGIKVTLFVLCVYFFVYEILKGIANYKGNRSYLIGRNPKLIHNYVKRIMLRNDLRTTPMNKCDYIVMGEENHEIEDSLNGYSLGKQKPNSYGILTIGKVFQHNLPKADTCISLALAKMLRRRFAKFPLDEPGCRKALDFVLEGLIGEIGGYRYAQIDRNDGKRNKMNRVFSIIEEELTLVDNLLFFMVPTYYFRWYAIMVLFGLLLVLANGIYLIQTIRKRSYAWLSLRALEAYNQCFFHVFGSGSEVVKKLSHVDLAITILLVVTCIFSLLPESVGMVRTQSWSNLKYLERYLENPANWCSSGAPSAKKLPKKEEKKEEAKKVDAHWFRRNWFRRIYPSWLVPRKKARKYSSVLDPSLLPKWIRRKYPSPFLSADAKEAILTFLRESGGQLTNGETSLRKYGMEHLNWACKPNGSNTEAILVWHIATTLLLQNNGPNQESAPQQNNKPFTKEAALSLSSYCHYLVSDLPELLPDDVKWTKKMYGNVMKDILSIPWSCDRWKYALLFIWHESSVVGKGAKLAKELMNCAKERTHVWTMLAHFWAEMMLFIAPSNNVDGHLYIIYEKELITQLWALLTHAGIITRPKLTEHQGDESESNEIRGGVNV